MSTLYITPSSAPTAYICRRVRIPYALEYMAAVSAALQTLTYPEHWLEIGGISPQDAVDAMQALFNEYLNEGTSNCMIGVIFPCATSSLPDFSLPCDGSSHLRVDYPELYAALDAAFITDADHFITPDLRGRTPIGTGQGSGLTNRNMNDSGGEETHVLSTAEMPSHAHIWGNGFAAAPGPTVVATFGPNVGQNTGSAGSGSAHQNMPPFRAIKYGIWAK